METPKPSLTPGGRGTPDTTVGIVTPSEGKLLNLPPQHPKEIVDKCRKDKKEIPADDVLFHMAVGHLSWYGMNYELCPTLGRKAGCYNNCRCLSSLFYIRSVDGLDEDGIPDDDKYNSRLATTHAVARYVVHYVKLDEEARGQEILHSIRVAMRLRLTVINHKCSFMVPIVVGNDNSEDELPLVCRATMQIISGYKYDYWNTKLGVVGRLYQRNIGIIVDAKYRPSSEDIDESLDEYFDYISRLGKNVVAMTVYDLYASWVRPRGWLVWLTAKDTIKKKPRGDGEWAKRAPLPIFELSQFIKYMKKNDDVQIAVIAGEKRPPSTPPTKSLVTKKKRGGWWPTQRYRG